MLLRGLAALRGAERLGLMCSSTSYVETCCLRSMCIKHASCGNCFKENAVFLFPFQHVEPAGCREPSPGGRRELGFPQGEAPKTFSPPALFSDLVPYCGREMLQTLISAFPVTELLLEMWLDNSITGHLPVIYFAQALASSISVCRLSGGKWESPKLSYSEGFIGMSVPKMFGHLKTTPITPNPGWCRGVLYLSRGGGPKGPSFSILKLPPRDSRDPSGLLEQLVFARRGETSHACGKQSPRLALCFSRVFGRPLCCRRVMGSSLAHASRANWERWEGGRGCTPGIEVQGGKVT